MTVTAVGRVVVAGLGPAGPELFTADTRRAIERIPRRYLRTARHPSASCVPDAVSFDDVYETAGSFEEVYERIVDALVEVAGEHGEVLYLVPGSPLVAERTVALLAADGRVGVEVLAGVSFLDLAWARLGVDPVAAGVRVIDGRRFAVEAAGDRGPLLVAQCDALPVLSEVKLALDSYSAAATGHPLPRVTVLQRLGLAEEAVFSLDWDELDRAVEPDHLTSLYIPALAPPVAAELVRFAELVPTLRERCPWDREQTHQSLTRHLLEEAYETLEAVEGLGRDGDDAWGHLEEELGDLLFQVFFHATLAAEAGRFTLGDVARGIHDKLVRRHPHVFGGLLPDGTSAEGVDTASAVVRNWEVIKQDEKGHESLMDGVPGVLPALLYAHKVQRRAASVGYDWPSVRGAYDRVAEELAVVQADPSEEEVGELLFSVVSVARHLGVDPEVALRGATAKFRDRFRRMERLAAGQGLELGALDLAGLRALWYEAKARR